MVDRPEHVIENARYWNAMADEWVASGERSWARDSPTWGCWELADAGIELLPADLSGQRAIELGCGTGYISAWMARRGANVLAVDVSTAQLATARRLAAAHGETRIEFRECSAEEVEEPDGSFDFAVSEYGAAIWCDPYVWIPEAHRLLRPGGQLHFLGNHPLAMSCTPEDGSASQPVLHRDWFGMHRFDWRHVPEDPGGVEFNLTPATWLRLFRDVGFDVVDHLELQAPAGAEDRYNVPGSWASRWPAEQVWKLRRR